MVLLFIQLSALTANPISEIMGLPDLKPMQSQLTWNDAIEKVLRESSEPLDYKEITDRIISDGLRTELGKTPHSTVNSLLNQNRSNRYCRIVRGIFTLADKIKDVGQEDQIDQRLPVEENGEQDSIVSSFGMFWRREEVEWKSPKNLELLGVQRGEADPVNFSQQIGLYLLYDGREVIYVGRAKTDNSTLGGRLYVHTEDRLSARWDRFSWFGFLPVSRNGELGELQGRYDSDRMIDGIEAILIEALEPRQNRKRGDDLEAVEYLQKESPNLAKQKAMQAIRQL